MAPTAPAAAAGADLSSESREVSDSLRPAGEAACRRDVGPLVEPTATATAKPSKASSKAEASSAAEQHPACNASGRSSAGGQFVQLSVDDDESEASETGSATGHDAAAADFASLLDNIKHLALDDTCAAAAATAELPDADGSAASSGGERYEADELTSHGPLHGRPVYASGYTSAAAYVGGGAAIMPQPIMRTVFRCDDRGLPLLCDAALPPLQTKRSAPVESDPYSLPNFASKYRYGGCEGDSGVGPTEDDGYGCGYDFDGERLPSDDLVRLLRTLMPAAATASAQLPPRQRLGSETTASESSWDPADSPLSAATASSPASSSGSVAPATAVFSSPLSGLSPCRGDEVAAAGSPQSWPPSPSAPQQWRPQQQQLPLGSTQSDGTCYPWNRAYPTSSTAPGAQLYAAGFSGSSEGGRYNLYAAGGGCYVNLPAAGAPSRELLLLGGGRDAQVPPLSPSPVLTDSCTLYGESSLLGGGGCFEKLPPLPSSDGKQVAGQEDELSEKFEIINQVIRDDLLQTARLREQAAVGPTTTVVPTTVSALASNGAAQQQQQMTTTASTPVIVIIPGLSAVRPPTAPAPTPRKERPIRPRDVPPTATNSSPAAAATLDQHKAKAKPSVNEDAANKATSLENRLLAARRAIAAIPDSDLRLQDAEGNTYLHRVVLKPDAYLVRAILERLYRSESMQGMVNLTNKAGQTAVYLATVKNHKLIVELLVQCNADVNIHATCPEFQAPLHHAASFGDRTLEVLHCLLKARFLNLNVKLGNSGRTPLHCAILSHQKADATANSAVNAIATVRALLAAGARLDVQGELDGYTPLHHAVASGCFELVRVVIASAGVPSVDSALRTVTLQGDTCLHLAAALRPASMPALADRAAILQLLVKCGARTAALNLRRQRAADLLLPLDDAEVKRLMAE